MANTTNPYVRKSVYDLSSEEIQTLRNAFSDLYAKPVAGEQSLVSKFAKRYQELANILITLGHYQRNDLLFLPWARAYFYTFEQALRTVEPSVTLPWWDYTCQKAIEEGIPALLSDESYVDANGQTQANPLFQAAYKFPVKTYREVADSTAALSSAVPVKEAAMSQSEFVNFSVGIYPVDIISHVYIGGSSANTNTAAYDPIFWFTHCQLDHFWWQWQQQHDNQGMPGSVMNAKLQPFVQQSEDASVFLTGSDVLNTEDLGYTYA